MEKTENTQQSKSEAKTRSVGVQRLVMRIRCLFGKHDREYWTDEQCEQSNVFGGIFCPWKCKNCSAEGQVFPIPEMLMRPCKQPKDCDA